MKENQSNPPDQRLKGILRVFMDFREKKAQLLTGVEDSSSTNLLTFKLQTPVFNELHQLFVKLFNEINATKQNHFDSTFRADMLLTALCKDYYSFQRNVRNSSPETILEQLCALFIPS